MPATQTALARKRMSAECYGFDPYCNKYYPYQEIMNNEALKALLHGVKDVLDPQRRVNPGALGLR